jgi:hypothetical protein
MIETTEKAILAGDCFWGMQDLLRKRPDVISTPWLHRRRRPQRDLSPPRHARRGDRDRLRPQADHLPRHPRVLLPDPRPDDEESPGQRRRHQLPLGDLLPRPRAGAGRARDDRGRRRLRAVARQGRHRGRAGRAVLGGRARPSGLLGALPRRLHMPLRAAQLEAPAPPGGRAAHGLAGCVRCSGHWG